MSYRKGWTGLCTLKKNKQTNCPSKGTINKRQVTVQKIFVAYSRARVNIQNSQRDPTNYEETRMTQKNYSDNINWKYTEEIQKANKSCVSKYIED